MQLILDIFAMRARSHEGKLQVHLAQAQISPASLAGQGIMLSRQAGGITRGPGESQLELNRRCVRSRFMILSANSRQWRKSSKPFVKTVGIQYFQNRTYRLHQCRQVYDHELPTSKSQYEADRAFCDARRHDQEHQLSGQLNVTLTDTVGQDLPTELVSLKSTLEESKMSICWSMLLTPDPHHEEYEKTVLDIMKELDMLDSLG